MSSVCEALTRNGRPCRGYGMPVDGGAAAGEGAATPLGYLCHMHRDYFTDHKIDWHLTAYVHPYMNDMEHEWVLRALRSPLYSRDTPWFLQHLRQLEGDQYHRANRLYELYVRAGVVAPMASLAFWRRVVKHNLRVLGYGIPYDPFNQKALLSNNFPYQVRILLRHLVSSLPPQIVIPYLLLSMKEPLDITPPGINPLPRATLIQCSAEIWREILSAITPLLSSRSILCTRLESILEKVDAEHEDTPDSVWWQPGMREHVLSGLKALEGTARQALKWRMEPLREEIIAAAWHPTRVERWLEAGVELEDL